jgi:predicted NBD/HSP70 family sugar kinase
MNGELFAGETFNAGELGHVVVAVDGRAAIVGAVSYLREHVFQ